MNRLRFLHIGRFRHSARRRLLCIPALTALGRPARRKYAILLMVALLFAQYVLIVHQIDHQSQATDAVCDMCLTAQHLGNTPISKGIPPVIVHGQGGIAFSPVVSVLSSRIITGFSARAPPPFLHV